jgi:flagellar biosynthesis GTPase FlhF
MKKTSLMLFITSVCFGVFAFKTYERSASEVLKQLDIPHDIAKDAIWSSFSGGYFYYPHKPQLAQTPKGERAAIVQSIGAYTKSFTTTDEFAKRYQEYRQQQRPQPPERPKTMEESRKAQKEEMQKSIHETEQNLKSMPAEQQSTVKEIINTMKEQLKSLDDPKNPMFSKEIEEAQTRAYEAEMVEHKNKLTKWEHDYPTSSTPMIKRWLTDFLEVSKDVDFNAKLVTGDHGVKAFANPDYEIKSPNWKLCFRAGKETVEAGRAFAKQWLNELNKGK